MRMVPFLTYKAWCEGRMIIQGGKDGTVSNV